LQAWARHIVAAARQQLVCSSKTEHTTENRQYHENNLSRTARLNKKHPQLTWSTGWYHVQAILSLGDIARKKSLSTQ